MMNKQQQIFLIQMSIQQVIAIIAVIIIICLYGYIDTLSWQQLRDQEEFQSNHMIDICKQLEQENLIDKQNFTYYQDSQDSQNLQDELSTIRSLSLKQRTSHDSVQVFIQRYQGVYKGMLQSIENSNYIYNALSSQGYNVIVSSRQGNIHNIDQLIKVQVDIWKKYTKQLKFNMDKKNIIIGHSFGGLISTRLTQTYQDLFDQLIIVTPFFGLNPQVNNLIYENLIRRWLKRLWTNNTKNKSVKSQINIIYSLPHLWKIQTEILQNAHLTRCKVLLFLSNKEHLVDNYNAMKFVKNHDNPHDVIYMSNIQSHYLAKKFDGLQEFINQLNLFQY